eukprot:4710644-Pyramimonas_sp.AAC.1
MVQIRGPMPSSFIEARTALHNTITSPKLCPKVRLAPLLEITQVAAASDRRGKAKGAGGVPDFGDL